ncbi:S1 family peptidase [Bdellovibrio sp. HCB2-146]|uniref:S1 family peptidase n=1 Tax=Bdellovibrio sp. HCB2-146 TaxID=3394362 RepID=UPI0039BD0424
MNKISAFSILSMTLAAALVVGCARGEQEVLSQGNCIPRKNFHGIVGGSTVRASESSSKNAVLITYDDSQGKPMICTGTLIARNAVITAAHCAYDATNVRVVFHTDVTCESDFNLDTQSIRATHKNINPSYRPNIKGAYDLALYKLAANAPSNYPVMPLYNGITKLSNYKVTLLGYGTTGSTKRDSMFLRKVTKNYKMFKRDGLNLSLDQSDKQGICVGDSGGPVYFDVEGQLHLAGVNSVVYGKNENSRCEGGSMSMYVPSYRSWIDRVLLSWK